MSSLILQQVRQGRSRAFVQGYRHGLRLDVADNDRMAQLIVTALEDGYTSGVEALLSYAMEGETIYGRFRDGAQTFGYSLKDNEISYWLLDGSERADSLLERPVWRSDRNPPTKGPKGRKCTKGIKCGLSCINSRKTCRIEPSPQAKQAIQEAKAEIKGQGKGKAAKKAKPKAQKAETKGREKAPKHKPLMTEEEAISYTQNSKWKDRVLFHGTNAAGADAITTKGIDPSRNSMAVFGQGFYMGGTTKEQSGWDIAASYGGIKEGDSKVLEMRVNVQNPLTGTAGEILRQVQQATQEGKIKPPDFSNPDFEGENKRHFKEISDYFKSEGYDGVEVTDKAYFVAFDPSQVAIYQTHNSAKTPPKDVAGKIKQERG